MLVQQRVYTYWNEFVPLLAAIANNCKTVEKKEVVHPTGQVHTISVTLHAHSSSCFISLFFVLNSRILHFSRMAFWYTDWWFNRLTVKPFPKNSNQPTESSHIG
jgi:hypothetical protein